MQKKFTLVLLLFSFFLVNKLGAQTHDYNSCRLNKNYNPGTEGYGCKVCRMEIEKAKAAKQAYERERAKQMEENSAKREKDYNKAKAAAELEKKMQEENIQNTLRKDSLNPAKDTIPQKKAGSKKIKKSKGKSKR